MNRSHSRHSHPDGFMPPRLAFMVQHGHKHQKLPRFPRGVVAVIKKMQRKKDRQRTRAAALEWSEE